MAGFIHRTHPKKFRYLRDILKGVVLAVILVTFGTQILTPYYAQAKDIGLPSQNQSVPFPTPDNPNGEITLYGAGGCVMTNNCRVNDAVVQMNTRIAFIKHEVVDGILEELKNLKEEAAGQPGTRRAEISLYAINARIDQLNKMIDTLNLQIVKMKATPVFLADGQVNYLKCPTPVTVSTGCVLSGVQAWNSKFDEWRGFCPLQQLATAAIVALIEKYLCVWLDVFCLGALLGGLCNAIANLANDLLAWLFKWIAGVLRILCFDLTQFLRLLPIPKFPGVFPGFIFPNILKTILEWRPIPRIPRIPNINFRFPFPIVLLERVTIPTFCGSLCIGGGISFTLPSICGYGGGGAGAGGSVCGAANVSHTGAGYSGTASGGAGGSTPTLPGGAGGNSGGVGGGTTGGGTIGGGR